jgi:hypothetical protein
VANLSIVFDGLALHTEPNGPYLAADDGQGIDWGSQEVADALLTGQYRPEEYDQVAAEMGLRRTVTIPLRIRSSSADTARTQEQALVQKITGASIFSPKLLVVVPQGSSHTSTFTVYGGAWQSSYTQTQSNTNTIAGTLTLVCDWPVLGTAQNLGSSGSPLISNTASPASVTVTPTTDGDAPGNVTLFVKNRAASAAVRSLIVGTVSGNTTWTALVDSSSWTVGADGARDTTDATTKNTDMVKKTGNLTANTVYQIANWAAPTLPSDRRFVVWLRVQDASQTGGFLQFRLRHVSGSVEVVGGWRSVPVEANNNSWVGAKMGAWPFPPGGVSSVGAAGTTTYLEMLSVQDVTRGSRIEVRLCALYARGFDAHRRDGGHDEDDRRGWRDGDGRERPALHDSVACRRVASRSGRISGCAGRVDTSSTSARGISAPWIRRSIGTSSRVTSTRRTRRDISGWPSRADVGSPRPAARQEQ